MTPMRLAQTLEERQQRSRDASSPAPETESQDVDSQEADSETEESQQPSIDRHTVPRSPRDKSVSEDDSDVAPSTAKDDDEFPDIDDLLQGKNRCSGEWIKNVGCILILNDLNCLKNMPAASIQAAPRRS